MIFYFQSKSGKILGVQTQITQLDGETIEKLNWAFGDASYLGSETIAGLYKGPRSNMVTPWSTNAVEITQNMGISGIERIEEFEMIKQDTTIDPMLSKKFDGLDQTVFDINIQPASILEITDIAQYNREEGLALNQEEVTYLKDLAIKLGRNLTDSEVFGFSQVNSEHCRHKIFNGIFVIDGVEKEKSLFKMIKETSLAHPNTIVSAYKDNVAFIDGPRVTQFAPIEMDKPSIYVAKPFNSILSLKAETHNFPTTVEPFNGAATGAGGEIRDRMAGGTGSIPLAGTAVYMTSYSRLTEDKSWEQSFPSRPWLYQSPLDILIKASNGASDFGNKFGQPLIAGSLFTFEHQEGDQNMGFDKVIMLAGGVGYGKKEMALKNSPQEGDSIVVLGGDNYRIGMGGAAVSSADTGEFSSGIELNAVQRSNPEMQKRVANTVRAFVESDINPIVSIHDHGAGGHLNCLSELVEEKGGLIDLDKLPIGDKTLSAKEIIGNESQERMGLVISEEHIPLLSRVAERERSPMYEVGKVTNHGQFTFKSSVTGLSPMNLALADMFGSSPKTYMIDQKVDRQYEEPSYQSSKLEEYLAQVLRLEAVACKDWLTNKVDRCVGGKVAMQQCVGPLQLPLNNCGIMALDYENMHGVATSIGHAAISSLIDSRAGAKNAITKALTNIIWAPLQDGLQSVSLSANWMWPCRNAGEDARLYEAVEAVSEFAINLGINIPTGKDSLSMSQKYKGMTVVSPGTVIISAGGHCDDFTKAITPVLSKTKGGNIYYLGFTKDEFKLGGSAFYQVLSKIGQSTPTIQDDKYVKKVFDFVQKCMRSEAIYAGHDVSSGGLVTTLLEMCFAGENLGMNLDFTGFEEVDSIKILFSENCGIVIQADPMIEKGFALDKISFVKLGTVSKSDQLTMKFKVESVSLDIPKYRDIWFETSYLLDIRQSGAISAKARYENYKHQPLKYVFPKGFNGKRPAINHINIKPKAAIIREKGSNSEREMANALYQAGFEVRDVHMTDLISGRETLEDIQFLGAVGGFSNSDVLGSAKGWAGAFKYNEKANKALKQFFARPDTMSIGICNGCQLFMELDLIYPGHEQGGRLTYNDSQKHESNFTSVVVEKSKSIMLKPLEGCTLGVWISHGEGKFALPYAESKYQIAAKYGYEAYPANPNGSDFNTAMMVSEDGRHLVTMPHIERSFFAWNWPYYQEGREDQVSPWVLAFTSAKEWVEKVKG